MDGLVRLIPVAVLSAVLALIVKKDNPLTAFLISLAAVTLMLISLLSEIQTVTAFLREMSGYSSLKNETILPLIKIVGVSIVTGIASQLCKDANEGTLSYAAELLGVISAVLIALPLFTQVLSLILSLV